MISVGSVDFNIKTVLKHEIPIVFIYNIKSLYGLRSDYYDIQGLLSRI
jgi:hypothetical protein